MHATTGGSDNHMHPETNPVGIRTRSVNDKVGFWNVMRTLAQIVVCSVEQRFIDGRGQANVNPFCKPYRFHRPWG